MIEKYSKEWWKKLESTIEEKYKYLLKTDFDSRFYNILNFEVDEIISNDKNQITEIMFNIKLDYMGSCDGEADSLSSMIYKVSTEVQSFFNNWQIHPKSFNLTTEGVGIVSTPFISSFIYNVDEDHIFQIYIRIDYEQL